MSVKLPMNDGSGAARMYSHDEHSREQFDAVFGLTFLSELSRVMGPRPNAEEADKFGDGLYAAIETYLDGRYDQENHQPEKAENKALAKVAAKSRELNEALLGLYGFGQTDKKLADEIRKFDKFTPGSSPAALNSLLTDHPTNPLLFLREMIVDLSVAAENTINRQPKHDDELAGLFGEEYENRVEAETRRWRKRSAAHRLSHDYALLQFIGAFRRLWVEHSDLPFTEGMHYADIGTTVSHAIDAIEMIFARLDAAVDRTGIITAMRKARKSADRKTTSSQ